MLKVMAKRKSCTWSKKFDEYSAEDSAFKDPSVSNVIKFSEIAINLNHKYIKICDSIIEDAESNYDEKIIKTAQLTKSSAFRKYFSLCKSWFISKISFLALQMLTDTRQKSQKVLLKATLRIHLNFTHLQWIWHSSKFPTAGICLISQLYWIKPFLSLIS